MHPSLRPFRSLSRRVAPALVAALLTALVVVTFPASAGAASVPAPRGTGGAVASDAPLATRAGLEILAADGNAVDAAVATALVLAVTFPEAGNLGGGGFAVVRMVDHDGAGDASTARIESLDFREVAPAAARRDMYLGPDGEPVPEASRLGPLASGVPGSPAGLHALHRRHGRLNWQRVVEPAVALARDGFVVDENLHRRLEIAADLLGRFPETAAVWLPGGEPPAVGSTMRLPELAATLAAYAEHGPEALTTGPVAERIEAVAARHGGILTAADLAAYEPAWRPPVRFDAFGWELASMDLPSSGGAILAQVFGVLERLGWGRMPRFGAERAHVLTEAFRGAYADRFRMGDPSVTESTTAELTGPEWIARQAAAIDPRRARDSRALVPHPGPPPAEANDTTHLSVVDAEGNAVALTTTLNGLFGSKLWVPGFGFLNNEMDDFAAAPGRPNMFGLVQGEANAVRPGKRMLSSMSPTLAWRPAGPRGPGEVLALGGRGGSRIPTNGIQVLLARMVDGDDLQAALDRPRLHHQWLPDRLEAEPDTFAPETAAVLRSLGHRLEITPQTAKVNAARAIFPAHPGDAPVVVEAASDPRSPGLAAVVEPAAAGPERPGEI